MPNDAKQVVPDDFDSKFLDSVNEVMSGKARTYCLAYTSKENGTLTYAFGGGSWETLGILSGVAASIEENLRAMGDE